MSEQTDIASQTMGLVIDQTIRAPWVLVEVQLNAEDEQAFGVKLHAGGGIGDLRTIAVLLRKVLAELEPEVAPVTRIFTFGDGQTNPVTGLALEDRYVSITAESIDHCRAMMLNHFGNAWVSDYATPEKAGVDRFDLRELPRDEWPPPSDRFYVDATGAIRTR